MQTPSENPAHERSSFGRGGLRTAHRPMLPTLAVLALIALVLSVLPAAPAWARSPYPETLPDFAHRDAPHSPLYAYNAARPRRPMLVLYLQFDGVETPGRDAAWAARRYFGDFPSVADYFREESRGGFRITPAAETSTADNGAVNDGVVVLDMGDRSDFFGQNNDAERNRLAVDAADPFVDFSAFDRNSDGRITRDELVLQVLEQHPNPRVGGTADGTAAHRGIARGGRLDGMDLSPLSVAMANTSTNLMSIIHETGHQALDMRDLYGFGVGRFDIMGPTVGFPDQELWRTTCWQKLHLGWHFPATPQVVTRDGWYPVRRPARDATAFEVRDQCYILYDPDVGEDHYYVVENRGATAGTYDVGASGTGLVIWRIRDSLYDSNNDDIRPIDLQRPDGARVPSCPPPGADGSCYSGRFDDAWNPLGGDRLGLRTFEPPIGPRVAVRGIRAAANVTWVYFDVRGPGVMVDPHTEQGLPITPDAFPGETTRIEVPVRNTGEEADTFDVSLAFLPAGWTAGSVRLTLAPQEETTVSLPLTPPADAPAGRSTIGVVGQSTTERSVWSRAFFDVQVILLPTTVDYTGATSGFAGQPAGFAAQVETFNFHPADNEPVAGVEVSFALDGPGGTQTVTATTDGRGRVSISPALAVLPGDYTLTASTERSGKYEGYSTSVGYTVHAPPDAGGPYTGDEGSPIPLDGAVVDPGGALTVGWDYRAGADVDPGARCAFADAADPATTITCTDSGTFILSLSAADGAVTATDTVRLSVANVAPAVQEVSVSEAPLPVGTSVKAEGVFSDPGANDTHTCTVDWGDETVVAGTVDPDERVCTGTHTYTAPGVYQLTVTVSDDDGGVGTSTSEDLVVFDRDAGFVTGAGWIDSPPGAYMEEPTASGRAHFSVSARYPRDATAPVGDTRFRLRAGGFSFESTALRWLVVAGDTAQYRGLGTVNGRGGYAFLLTATDGRASGGRTDRLRLKVWDRTTGAVVYDLQPGDDDRARPVIPVGGGNITVHH